MAALLLLLDMSCRVSLLFNKHHHTQIHRSTFSVAHAPCHPCSQDQDQLVISQTKFSFACYSASDHLITAASVNHIVMTWVVRTPILPTRKTLPKRSPRRCYNSNSYARTSTMAHLSPDQKAVADAAIKVTRLLSQQPSSLTTLDLLAFCNVKGIPLPDNIWDRNYLQSAARDYQRKELLARTKTGPQWEALTEKAKIKLLHDVCNGEGDVTYLDPATGYTVFSFFAHLRRGHCCGIQEKDGTKERTHRCRHCPYKDDGTLGHHMLATKERIPLIEYVRNRATQSWESSDSLKLESGPHISSAKPAEILSGLSERELRAKYARVVKIEKKPGDWNCDSCSDEKIVTCTRCNGWTYLFSPQLMKCPQCDGKGYHPCINCTSFRPPQRTSFYS